MPLTLDRLVHTGHVSLARVVELLGPNPARILGIDGGTLAPGVPAHITVLAPDATTTVVAESFRSKARNTPFDGWELRGAVAATLMSGRPVYTNPAVAGAEVFEEAL